MRSNVRAWIAVWQVLEDPHAFAYADSGNGERILALAQSGGSRRFARAIYGSRWAGATLSIENQHEAVEHRGARPGEAAAGGRHERPGGAFRQRRVAALRTRQMVSGRPATALEAWHYWQFSGVPLLAVATTAQDETDTTARRSGRCANTGGGWVSIRATSSTLTGSTICIKGSNSRSISIQPINWKIRRGRHVRRVFEQGLNTPVEAWCCRCNVLQGKTGWNGKPDLVNTAGEASAAGRFSSGPATAAVTWVNRRIFCRLKPDPAVLRAPLCVPAARAMMASATPPNNGTERDRNQKVGESAPADRHRRTLCVETLANAYRFLPPSTARRMRELRVLKPRGATRSMPVVIEGYAATRRGSGASK